MLAGGAHFRPEADFDILLEERSSKAAKLVVKRRNTKNVRTVRFFQDEIVFTRLRYVDFGILEQSLNDVKYDFVWESREGRHIVAQMLERLFKDVWETLL